MQLQVGDKASVSKTISETDIYTYAGITGDFNSMHVNAAASQKGMFGERIAHGMLAAGLISAVLGTKLPGDGAVYLSQNLSFLAPVKINDTITATCEVKEIINKKKGIFRLVTICTNQRNECVIDGEAVIKYMQEDLGTNCRERIQDSFYDESELAQLGLKRYGSNVKISRRAVFYHPGQMEIGDNVRIDDYTTVSGKIVLGDYIHIAQFCGLYGGTEGIYMDDFSGLSSRVVIYATSNDYSGESMTNPTVPAQYRGTDKNLPVHLCRHVIVGTTSVILPGVTIGEGSSVGAMSMCTKDLAPWGVYAGSPIRKIRERSKTLLRLEQDLRREENRE